MIMPGAEIKVFVATKPVDFRKQADSLAALAQEALSENPYSGAIYVFRSKRTDRVKLLWWDGTGAIQSGALTLRIFRDSAVFDHGASLRFPSEFATIMVIDAKRNANFRGRLKNCQ
jgi:hypothetical protein